MTEFRRPIRHVHYAHVSRLVRNRRTQRTQYVDFLCGVGHRQQIHFLWRPSLPDPQDEFVLELAVAANCEAIITHNVRDFVGAKKFKPQVLTPSAFLARMWKSL